MDDTRQIKALALLDYEESKRESRLIEVLLLACCGGMLVLMC
jgi:hypothetical protein